MAYEQIILFGRSLGSGPAVGLASQYPVGGHHYLKCVSPISICRISLQLVKQMERYITSLGKKEPGDGVPGRGTYPSLLIFMSSRFVEGRHSCG